MSQEYQYKGSLIGNEGQVVKIGLSGTDKRDATILVKDLPKEVQKLRQNPAANSQQLAIYLEALSSVGGEELPHETPHKGRPVADGSKAEHPWWAYATLGIAALLVGAYIVTSDPGEPSKPAELEYISKAKESKRQTDPMSLPSDLAKRYKDLVNNGMSESQAFNLVSN